MDVSRKIPQHIRMNILVQKINKLRIIELWLGRACTERSGHLPRFPFSGASRLRADSSTAVGFAKAAARTAGERVAVVVDGPGEVGESGAGEKGGRWSMRKAILERVRQRRPTRPRATMMARRMSASLDSDCGAAEQGDGVGLCAEFGTSSIVGLDCARPLREVSCISSTRDTNSSGRASRISTSVSRSLNSGGVGLEHADVGFESCVRGTSGGRVATSKATARARVSLSALKSATISSSFLTTSGWNIGPDGRLFPPETQTVH
ncbi:hypothetical protein B0H14DRAFT_2631717 [Mycena olivaceomarginata]|nr:hypothetical protein B0H14DRAFT_2631717 [Mycena olivaceomarginata]